MSDAATARLRFREVVPIVASILGAAMMVGGAMRADGGRDKQIEENTRRIEVLENSDKSKTDLLTKIDGRTIRIETKLEMMAPAKSGDAR